MKLIHEYRNAWDWIAYVIYEIGPNDYVEFFADDNDDQLHVTRGRECYRDAGSLHTFIGDIKENHTIWATLDDVTADPLRYLTILIL